jgi:DNA polymerase-3 subunit gamma/tau
MVRYAPAAARSKVVILDEAHMLTGEASNALLKTLEEPPDRVIFVMATTQPEDLEDTIRSRSQHFHFRALTFNEITDRLKFIAEKENLKIDGGALSVIGRMAEGSMRDALSLLEQARAYCGDNITDQAVRELLGVVPEDALQELVAAIAEQSAERALGLVHTFQKEGRNLQHFCREAIRHMRNLLIARVCGADSDLIAATPDQRPGLEKAASLFTEEDLTRFFQILLQTDDDLRRKPDPRVHLEMGLLRLVNAGRLAPLEELLTEARGGVTGGGSGGGRSTPNTTVQSSAPTFPSRTVSASAVSSFVVPAPVSVEPKTVAMPGPRFPAAGAATAPAMKPVDAPAPAARETTTETAAIGISAEQVAEIKAALHSQQKFVAELLEHAARWELEGSELRICFRPDKSTFAGLMEGRETLEKIRGASSNVLGRAVRVCARLESGGAKEENSSRRASNAGTSTQELRAQFENDPMVKSMLQRFGGRISEVKRQTEE